MVDRAYNLLLVLLGIVLLALMVVLAPIAGFAENPVELIRKYRPDLNKQRVAKIKDLVLKYSAQYKVDPGDPLSIMAVESEFENIQSRICEGTEDKLCVKPENREKSCSYFQMQPQTFHRTMGYWPEGETRTEMCRSLIKDYKTAIKAGVKHYADLVEDLGRANAIGSYNAGPDDGPDNLKYINKVTDQYAFLRGWEH